MLETTKKVIEECKRINKELHCFTYICEKEAIEQAKEIEKKLKKGTAGKLAGYFITLKDNICLKDVESTASSEILKGYKPVFDSSIAEALKKEDAIIIGKTVCDEFGFGSFNINLRPCFKIPKNPHDKERVCGGSSGGSAAITAKASFKHIAIAESTGGSIENPAAYCGVIGFCPSYGAVSRYGLISYADSLDKIGFMTKDTKLLEKIMDVAYFKDEKDATSIEIKKNTRKIKRIAVLKDFLKMASEESQKRIFAIIKELKKKFIVEEIRLKIDFDIVLSAYYIISCSEASSNLAKLCGMRYGKEAEVKNKYFKDYFKEIRSKYFTEESKRRIAIGTFARMSDFREDYYIKAAKVRAYLIEEYNRLFEKYDIIIAPTMPDIAPKIKDVKKLSALESYKMDVFTILPNLAGIPHASYPIKRDKMPLGLMAKAKHGEDYTLLSFLKELEGLECLKK